MEYVCDEDLANSMQNLLTTSDLSHKIDDLVSDLSLALDESLLPQYTRKRRGFKKRSKLFTSMGISVGINQKVLSDDSSSSIGEVACSQDNKSSIPLSDSDNDHHSGGRMRNLHLTHHRPITTLVESDSVNETFSQTGADNRRKQKCKRLAFDPSIRPSTSVARAFDRSCRFSLRRKKQMRMSPETERSIVVSGGKRKRGGIDFDIVKKGFSNRKRYGDRYASLSIQDHIDLNEPVDEEMESECSDDSSETGLYTCDEGREADDEQSDFFAEPGPSYGIPRMGSLAGDSSWWNPDNLQLSPVEKTLIKESYDKMPRESQQLCRLRFRKIKERLLRREIRAGKRRLHERRPIFNIITTINDKVAKFIMDPRQIQMRLNPNCERELDHLRHLADMYAFNIRTEGCQGTIILWKSRKMLTLRQLELARGGFSCGVSISSNEKRYRNDHNLTEGSNDSVESVVASGANVRPPVPVVSWGDENDVVDSLVETLADSEPEPIPSASSLSLHDCTL